MWFERFVIIVTSLHRDYIVSSWSYYTPTYVEVFIYLGTIGFFMTLFLIFAKVAPVIALAEVKKYSEIGPAISISVSMPPCPSYWRRGSWTLLKP